MGAACCVASRDQTIISRSSNDVLLRNVRYSPSWSFRCDNRVQVAGEDTSMNWFSNGVSRNVGMDFKSGSSGEAAYASEDGSLLNSSQMLTWQKSPISVASTERLPVADQSSSRKPPEEVEDSVQSPAISDPSPTKLSPSMNPISSLSTSPLSSRGHFLHQVSDTRIPSHKSHSSSISEESSFLLPGWSNRSNRGSNGGSSNSWSISASTELMTASHRERLSLDSRISSSPHTYVQTCGVCSKLVTKTCEMNKYQLSVIAVLVCGHVYHGECLENSTPEVSRYDPVCPVCTFGEKKTLKLSGKVLKEKLDLRARNKRSMKWIVNRDQDHDSSVFGDLKKSGRYVAKGVKFIYGSSMNSSSEKPFLKKHFSFGPKGTRSMVENHSDATRKKGFFWSKSTKQ